MNNKISPPQSFSKIRLEMSADALAFLAGTTKGIANWNIYYALLNLLCVEPVTIMKRGIHVSVVPGQVEACANSLRGQFNLGQKAMVEVLNKMHRLGLINWHPSKVASLAEMTSVLGWYDSKGEFKDNTSLCSIALPSIVQMPDNSYEQGTQQIPQQCEDTLVVETHQSKNDESQREIIQCQESDVETPIPASDAESIAKDEQQSDVQEVTSEKLSSESADSLFEDNSSSNLTQEAMPSQDKTSEPSAYQEPDSDIPNEDLTDMVRKVTGMSKGFDFSALQFPLNSTAQKNNNQESKTLKDNRLKAL